MVPLRVCQSRSGSRCASSRGSRPTRRGRPPPAPRRQSASAARRHSRSSTAADRCRTPSQPAAPVPSCRRSSVPLWLVEASQLQPYRKNRWPPQGGTTNSNFYTTPGDATLGLAPRSTHSFWQASCGRAPGIRIAPQAIRRDRMRLPRCQDPRCRIAECRASRPSRSRSRFGVRAPARRDGTAFVLP